MKIRVNYILLVVISLIMLSCKKDNYDAPSSSLTGRLLYNGEAIQVEYNRVPFELYQYGFGKVAPINSTISPEGTFSHLLFDGEYKFVVRPGQGPFKWPETGGKADTITIAVKGNTVRDVEVIPYYMIRVPKFTVAAGVVTGTFKIEQVITGADAKNIEAAALFINKTFFVGNDNNIAKTQIGNATITDPGNVSINVTIPAIKPVQNYAFARIGVKTAGVEDWIFSPVQKITF
jgi:hypothetical protein